jgi:hypothetical protein
MFAVCIGLIRAQPYNDAELRDFLLPPERCPAPCWQGIRPGVTTVDEAVAILEATGWFNRFGAGSIFLTAGWDQYGTLPPYVSADSPNGVTLEIVDNVIVSIFIETHIPVHRLRLLLGKPDEENFSVYQPNGSNSLEFVHDSSYYEDHLGQFRVNVRARCSRQMWGTDTIAKSSPALIVMIATFDCSLLISSIHISMLSQ